MADEKLTNLPSIPSGVLPSDIVYLVKGGVSYQCTVQQLIEGQQDYSGYQLYNYKLPVSTLAGPENFGDANAGQMYLDPNGDTHTLEAASPGVSFMVVQTDVTPVEFVPDGGETLVNVDGHTKTGGQYATVSLTCIAAGVWLLVGRTQA